MKKIYETPSAEKIRFNYRDQVVAASGVNGGSGSANKNPGDYSWQEWADAIGKWNFELTSVTVCKYV